jgi:hypothetical protein
MARDAPAQVRGSFRNRKPGRGARRLRRRHPDTVTRQAVPDFYEDGFEMKVKALFAILALALAPACGAIDEETGQEQGRGEEEQQELEPVGESTDALGAVCHYQRVAQPTCLLRSTWVTAAKAECKRQDMYLSSYELTERCGDLRYFKMAMIKCCGRAT